MPFAEQLGQRLRVKRLDLGMGQKQVADAIGVTATEIGRYEKGVDNISAIHLNEIAILFGVSPSSLYPPVHAGAGADTNVNGVVSTDELTKLLKDTFAIRLLRAFAAVRGKKLRAQVVDWVEAFASHRLAFQHGDLRARFPAVMTGATGPTGPGGGPTRRRQ
jgi:transcriptional regulator with XRE-family HTH domain